MSTALLMIGSRKPALLRALERDCDTPAAVWMEDPEKQSGALRGFFAQTDRAMSENHFAAVIATSESTLVLAALARARYGLPGPSIEAAMIATNKWLMRDSLRGKVRMPRFWLSSDPQRPRHGDFFSKPLDESAARGVKPTNGGPAQRSEALRLIEEEVIVTAEYHVDGVFSDGKVLWCIPSVYDRPVFLATTGSRTSMLLEEGETARQLVELSSQIAAEIRQPSGVFHMEFLESPDGFVFGEFGLRPGGGGIAAMLEYLLDADLWGAHIASQSGRDVGGFGPKRTAPPKAGLIMARRAKGHGIPIAVAQAEQLPGVRGADPGNSPPEDLPADSCSFAYALICEGLDQESWTRYSKLLSGGGRGA
ncbi:acetyl-CoA carboxylase biotin carboxylase subunit family protein [Arthrobacter sp. NPDC090010]|uniref:ATP-grasp domain-containing protein n=1 Tax=Arthrobacter sp. NPDC090010 TaxID=3363942 RepID=UPI0037F25F58